MLIMIVNHLVFHRILDLNGLDFYPGFFLLATNLPTRLRIASAEQGRQAGYMELARINTGHYSFA